MTTETDSPTTTDAGPTVGAVATPDVGPTVGAVANTDTDEPMITPVRPPMLPDQDTAPPPTPAKVAPVPFDGVAAVAPLDATRRRRALIRRQREDDAGTAAMVAFSIVALAALIGGLIWWAADDESGHTATDPIGDGAALIAVDRGDVIAVDGAADRAVADPDSADVVAVTDGQTLASGASEPLATPNPVDPAPPAPSVAPVDPPPTTVPDPVVDEPAPSEPAPGDSTAPPAVEVSPTTVEAIDANPRLGRFMTLLQDNFLLVEIDDAADVTVLAPTDDAVMAFASTDDGAAVFADPDATRAFLLHHLVWDRLDAATLVGSSEIVTADGTVIPVDPDAGAVGGAVIVEPDQPTAQGFVHTIDAVLLPVPTTR